MEGKYPGGPPDPYQPAAPPQYAPPQPLYPPIIPQQPTVHPGFVPPPAGDFQPPPTTGTGNKMYPPPPSYTPRAAPTIGVVMAVGPDPMNITCPSCGAQVVSQVRYEASTKTHILAALLCIIGCWPCVCIPYCTDSCQNGNHYCPSCQAYLGTYKS